MASVVASPRLKSNSGLAVPELQMSSAVGCGVSSLFLEAEDAQPFNGLDDACFSLEASEGAFHFDNHKDRYQEIQHAFCTHPCLSLEDQMHPQPNSVSQFLLLDDDEEETMHASSTRQVPSISKKEGVSKGLGFNKSSCDHSMKYEGIISDDFTPGYPASASLFLHNEEEDVSLYTSTYPAVPGDCNLSDGMVEDSNNNCLPPSKRSSDTSAMLQSSSEASVLQSYLTRPPSQCQLSANPTCTLHSSTSDKHSGALYCLAILDESSGKPIRAATCAEAHMLKQHKVSRTLPQTNRLISSSRATSHATTGDVVKQNTVIEPSVRVSRRQAKQEPEQCLDASLSSVDLEQGSSEVQAQVVTASKTFTCNPRRGGPCDYCGATESPQWRRGPTSTPVLCNACGMRFRRTNQLSPGPPVLVSTPATKSSSASKLKRVSSGVAMSPPPPVPVPLPSSSATQLSASAAMEICVEEQQQQPVKRLRRASAVAAVAAVAASVAASVAAES
ncbi:hypothetical protein CEUSTIGMA_g752.t1 [Chlamydomonas eustigma]|uniref:GATA-type domain-containing protein n=1 Tax=Chlamydomonas eustigma TaxID=1157962 RepID=A0A250WR47_9CHLO|nr:hypothetical protein CEUSTIGMA_g752.t1 [Chlamydomonas eustigma]|eukprot:GAX73298.1 hypothetical protein CEUSTIGMA_g752.t1 [Chlamydomonas eustigma]